MFVYESFILAFGSWSPIHAAWTCLRRLVPNNQGLELVFEQASTWVSTPRLGVFQIISLDS